MQAVLSTPFSALPFQPADILLPKAGTDLTRWSVVACDQFTSQPEYWQEVESLVGGAPSTLRLILPEAQLRSPEVERHIYAINETMERYCADGLFTEYPDALVYVERIQSDGALRRGLVGRLDLEQYEFTPGSHASVRATEGTVLSRIPPRVRVREHAVLEAPHVMLLYDDPEGTVNAAVQNTDAPLLYDFPLMLGGGSVRGRLLTEEEREAVSRALADLCTPEAMAQKYGLPNAAPLLFAVGDGNHSLATAKQCWENRKASLSEAERANHPARYALVEAVNLHEPALVFEPIHRVVFDVDAREFVDAFVRAHDAVPGAHAGHTLRFVWDGHDETYTVPHPAAQLAVGTLQSFLDAYTETHGGSVDYIHGGADARALGARPGNLAVLLPPMGKNALFKTVMADGVLPRKTFSMGEARDKRYYLECRRIR